MNEVISSKNIQERIFSIRGVQVMLDWDLAEIYEIETKRINEQVKRNIERFPEHFRFQLTNIEKLELVASCDRFSSIKHSSVNPYVFTEQGVSMLSAVLKSKVAVQVSIQIIESFVEMRKLVASNKDILSRVSHLEQKQITQDIRQNQTETKIDLILEALEEKNDQPSQGIFYDGQVFDAYIFVSDLIRKAKSSIILVDNYIDDSVLTLLSKRNKNVNVIIYTSRVNSQLQLDLVKYNTQYPTVEIRKFSHSHDRFLILDKKEAYHIGASIKDLGKKWFGFTRIDSFLDEILLRLKN